MNILRLSIRHTFQKKLNLTLTLGLLVISFIAWLLSVQVEQSLQSQLEKNVSGIDLVVGAKGSPMQLLLSSVLFSDSPTGNISIEAYEKIKKHPLVKSTIPIAQGDNLEGYPLVGTTLDFFGHYNAEVKNGELNIAANNVVVGYTAAKQLGVAVGDHLAATHGSGDGKSHDHEMVVSGIMEQNNSVLDKLVVSSIATVHHNHASVAGADGEITAAWLTFKSPLAMMQLPRMINTNTNMQAALPAIEMNRLMKLSGGGIKLVKVFSGIFLFLALYSILVHVYSSVKLHMKDLALLRLYGFTFSKLFLLLISQASIVTLLGSVLSIVLSKALFVVVNSYALSSFQLPLLEFAVFSNFDFQVLVFGLSIGLVASLLPILHLKRADLMAFLR